MDEFKHAERWVESWNDYFKAEYRSDRVYIPEGIVKLTSRSPSYTFGSPPGYRPISRGEPVKYTPYINPSKDLPDNMAPEWEIDGLVQN